MKILTVDQIAEADAYTIKHEPVASVDLMERAGNNCFQWIYERLTPGYKIMVYTGVGNNGGDGMVIARLLAEKDVDTQVIVLKFSDKLSEDAQRNLDLLYKQKKVSVKIVTEEQYIPAPGSGTLVVDAIFGSGLGRPVRGLPGKAIEKINRSEALVVAVDIPSGMYADKYTDENEGKVIHATYTLSLQMPKLAMMMPESARFVGEMHVIPIGLHPGYLNSVDATYQRLEKQEVSAFLSGRKKFAHKGDFGHALIMAGSYGKAGASVLAAKACLRSGVGLLTCYIPKHNYTVLQTGVPECMIITDKDKSCLSKVPDMAPYDVIAIGPGIGKMYRTRRFLKSLMEQCKHPVVLDADAINILAEHTEWFSSIPAGTILSPHPGEFDRLAGNSANHFDRLEKARRIANKYQMYIVLKGAHTAICTPRGKVWFNTTGNPGMASGGTGDALTGIITGLLAQGYEPFKAASAGVYIHGLAGDIALENKGEEALLASDLIEHLPEAFAQLKEFSAFL